MDFTRCTMIMCLFVAISVAVARADTPAHLYTVDLGPGNEDLEKQINALPWMNAPAGVYPMKDASRIDFSGRDLRCATIHLELKGLYGARFDDCRLEGSSLLETEFIKCSFRNARLRFCEMDTFSHRSDSLNDFTNADIGGSYFFGLPAESLKQTSNYQEKKLAGIKLPGGFKDVSFASFQLDRVHLPFWSGHLDGCDFTNASLNQMAITASLSKEQLYTTANYQGEDLSTLLFAANSLAGWDLSRCHLAYFERCDLTNVEFTDAWFMKTKAAQVNVYPSGTPLSTWQCFNLAGIADIGFDDCLVAESQLKETVNWKRKDLRGMHLKNMNLDGWDFSGMNMEEADLTGTSLKETKFTAAEVKQLKLDDSIGLTLEQLQESKTFRTTRETDILHIHFRANFDGLTDEQRTLQESLRKKWPKP